MEVEVERLDSMGDHAILDDVQLCRKVALGSSLQKWRMRKSQLFRQYSRSKNITEKDDNTKYFHALASHRMRKKMITKIKVGGTVVKGNDNIKRSIISHFLQHFQKENLPNITLPLNSFR